MKIRFRFLAGLFVLLAFMSSIYAYFLHDAHRTEYLAGVDRTLATAVNMAREILPPDYHDRISGKESVSPQDYLKIIDRWNRICRANGLQYLWSNMFIDDDIVFTTSTSTSKEVKNGDHALFFDKHRDPAAFDAVRQSEKPTYSTFSNEWGTGRMLLVPMRDSHGRLVVFGASIGIDVLDAKIRNSAINAAFVFVATLIAGTLMSYFLSELITNSLSRLASVARNIAGGQYGATVGSLSGGHEIRSLADSVNTMSAAILEHNQHLEKMVEKRTEELEARTKALDFQKFALDQHAIVSIADRDGTISYANDLFCQSSGYSREELVGKNHRILNSGFHPPEFFDELWRTIASGRVWHGEIRNKRKDGTPYWVSATIVPFPGGDGRPFQYVAIRTNITARKAAEESLANAKSDADEANRAKSDFLSSMSHELRTPLNSIIGFAQLLKSDDRHPLTEHQQEQLRLIESGGSHLLDLVNQVLQLSQIEAGKMMLTIHVIDPTEIFEECVSLAETLALGNGVTIEDKTGAEPLPWLLVDELRCKQAILNLLSNAVKYNRGHGRVEVSARRVDSRFLRVSIRDTGNGISPEDRDKIFEPFQRLKATASDVDGTGIGLVLTKRLAEEMGGTVDFESTPGEGSTFWIDFPLATDVQSDAPSPVLEAPPAPLPDIDGRERTLLYVEDNAANMALMADIVDDIPNLALISAPNAEVGIALVAEQQPDVAIFDINLPGMSGIDAVKVIKAKDETKDIPVLALSADAMPSSVQQGLDAGFQTYLTKPVNVSELVSALRDALDA